MILKTIVILIVLYELFRLLNLKTYIEIPKFMKEFNKLSTEEDRMNFFKKSKSPLLKVAIIFAEVAYLVVVVILLFTPLLWISVTMIILSVIIGLINMVLKSDISKIFIKLIDITFTIGLMVYAFHSVLN